MSKVIANQSLWEGRRLGVRSLKRRSSRPPSHRLFILVLIAVILIATGITWALLPDFKGNLNYSPATKIYDCKGRLMRLALGEKDRLSVPVPLSQTGEWTSKALVASEDKRFYTHHGVDPIAICRAALHNLKAGKIVSGASTISTLVVKQMEPRPRNLWTKIIEAHHAIRLERLLSKDSIIEQYLNRAPFGSNITGIEAASRKYFGKSASDLSLAETALLIGIPQSPSKLRPDLHVEAAVKRRNYVLAQMKSCRFISADQYARAIAQRMAVTRKPLPFQAPHFCEAVLKEFPREQAIKTTLDLELQAVAEQALRSGLAKCPDVSGGAAVILDVKTGAVRAMAGSPDFGNDANSGQVNGAMSRRSPGSALKLFAYALAMDQGMYSPETVVADVPVDLAGYRPQNFNREYSGPVSVKNALIQSLNIPALLCVRQVGLDNFVHNLRNLGMASIDKSPDHYGLGIVVGSCEVTLFELVNAYACLARRGIYTDPTMIEGSHHGREVKLFSEEAAFMITDILSGDERALDLSGHIADVDMPRVAWKTGTSAGNRDAWSIAYNPEYVVGVWIGNPDGRSSPALVGASVAAPVVYDVFRKIYPGGKSPWYPQPRGLKTREVCRDSGLVPRKGCPTLITSSYIPRITMQTKCTAHAGNDTDSRIAVTVNSDRNRIRSALAQAGIGRKIMRIISPGRKDAFHLIEDAPLLRQEIALRADMDESTGGLYWFVDKQFYRQAGPGEDIAWPLEKGTHVITCCDNRGHSDSATVMVE